MFFESFFDIVYEKNIKNLAKKYTITVNVFRAHFGKKFLEGIFRVKMLTEVV